MPSADHHTSTRSWVRIPASAQAEITDKASHGEREVALKCAGTDWPKEGTSDEVGTRCIRGSRAPCVSIQPVGTVTLREQRRRRFPTRADRYRSLRRVAATADGIRRCCAKSNGATREEVRSNNHSAVMGPAGPLQDL
jgi:hypothetical protein